MARAPEAIFNERVMCGLGRGIEATGRLHPDAVELALETLCRFATLARALQVEIVDAVATAAVREAADGQ